MTTLALTRTRIHAGLYEAVVTDSAPNAGEPPVIMLHRSLPLADLSLVPDRQAEGAWVLRVPIPAHLLAEGVETFLVKDETTGDTLDAFTIITGAPLEDDLRSEIALLRAELDLLKRAFRRHCVETEG